MRALTSELFTKDSIPWHVFDNILFYPFINYNTQGLVVVEIVKGKIPVKYGMFLRSNINIPPINMPFYKKLINAPKLTYEELKDLWVIEKAYPLIIKDLPQEIIKVENKYYLRQQAKNLKIKKTVYNLSLIMKAIVLKKEVLK